MLPVITTASLKHSTKPSAAYRRASFVVHGHVFTRPAQPLQPAFYASNKQVTQVNPAQAAIEFIVFNEFTVNSIINPNPTTSYFVETDPRFTNYRQWLSSDYLLAALGVDPATTQKRLGDGFYEQKLIREQVALLTGRRFTGDFTNDEAQYSALMQNAATYAKAHQLRPGIALSEAQMAQLTADIVWLVEKTLTLPNGQTVQALVPQVYVRVQPGDITGEGTLIAAERVNIQLSGDLTNSGTIAGRSVMRISADNVNNLGGRLAAADNTITAKNDINNVGGVISANDRLQLNAGRDINVTTTTSSGRSVTQGGVGVFERTSIDRVAGLYVTNPGGTLVASAGRDINLTAAVIQNLGGKDAKGNNTTTMLDARRNLNLATVTIGESSNVTFDAKNYARFSASQELGTQVNAAGNVLLKAGQDITAKAASIASQDGTTALVAGRDITLTTGQETFSYDKANQSTSKGFLSKTTTTTRETHESTTAIGSAVEGKQVLIQAGNTIRVTGSSVASDTGTTLIAGNNLIVESAQNTTSSSSTRDEKKSGLMTTGSGASLGISLSAKDNRTATRTAITQVGSSITSANGATTLIAQEGVLAVIGSNVSAGADQQLTLQGKQVVLSGALNSEESTLEQSKKSTNMHFGVVKPSEGMLSRGTLKGSTSSTNVAATTLSGGNISIKATGEPGKDAQGNPSADSLSGISLAGVKITTPGTLALDAGKGNLAFNILETTSSNSLETTQRDIAYQKAKGAGTSDGSAVYNDLSYGKLAIKADTITVQTGVGSTGKGQVPSNVGASSAATPAQLKDLASKPGMSWVNDVAAQSAQLAKTNPAAALHIQQVQLAHNQWDYKRQGLTKEGAAIVSLVVAYFTAGAGSGIAGAAGMTTTTVTAAGVATTTLTAAGTVVAAVAQAAITSLASQASVSMVNNQGNLSAVFKELGSSESVRGLLTAMVTAGALSGLNLAMANTGLTSTAWNSINATSPLMDQLQKNLVNQLTTNVLQTALTGGNSQDYEKGLQTSLLTAFITTGAAQGANAIGDMQANGTLNALTHKLAHAIAGCAAGAASASVAGGSGGSAGSGCGSGAIGAVIGELTAEAAGKSMKPEDLVNLSRLLAGVAGAMTGGDVNLAATAGGNAAENNFLNHKRPSMLRLSEVEQYERAVEECKTNPAACQLRDSLAQLSAQRDRELQQACSGATPELCNQKAREATSMGNVVTGSNGGVVIASSTSPGPIKNLNVPTIGSPTDPRTGTFQDTLARSTAEALLLESGNQVALAIVGTALKAVGVTTQTVKNYFASTGVTISDDAAARIANNFYREGGDPKTIEAMFNSAASSSTRNASSGEVVLGKYVTGSSQSYEKVAIARGATYFEVPDWAATQLLLGEKEMWNINKAFLDQQIAQGKSFVFTGNPKLMSKGSYGAMEFEHLTKSGYKFTEKGGFFYGAK